MAPLMPCALQKEPQIAFYRASALCTARGSMLTEARREHSRAVNPDIAAGIGEKV